MFRTLTINLFVLTALLLMMEIAARSGLFSTSVSDSDTPPPPPLYSAHDVLGHRPNAGYPGHDARGWRNLTVVEQADIVALGDSQTYGVNAKPDQTWPHQLSQMSGRSTYQLAFGGYGPAHYLVLLDDALKLQPKVLVAGFYSGNDLMDNYWFTYNMKPDPYKWTAAHSQLLAMRNTDPAILRSMRKYEEIDPHHVRTRYLDCQRTEYPGDDRAFAVDGLLSLPPLKPLAEQFPWRYAVRHPIFYIDREISRWSHLPWFQSGTADVGRAVLPPLQQQRYFDDSGADVPANGDQRERFPGGRGIAN